MLIIATATMAKAQETFVGHSSVEVNFSKFLDEDTTEIFSFYDYCCHVTQEVIIDQHPYDSLKLELKVCNFHPLLLPFFYNNMEVYGIDNGNTMPLQFDLSTAGIAIDHKDYDTINLSFYFNPNSIMLYKYKVAFYGMVFYQSGWQSMFFTKPGMEFDEIKVIYTNDIVMFWNRQDLQDPKINAFLINPDYYITDTLSKSPDITAYLFKGSNGWQDSISGDWYDYEPDEKSHPESRLPSNIVSVVDNLSEFFNTKITSLNYIDTYTTLADTDNEACWGEAYRVDDENWFIVIDTSFWNSYLWCHETTHCFNTKLPSRNDSSYYFFNESMTEFISIYFGTPDKNDIDSIFIKRVEKYGELPDDYPSIFQVRNSDLGLDGSGTFNVTYVKTPYCLHLLAKDVGERRFLKICKGFYKKISKMETYTYDDFEDYILRHGVSKKKWNHFMKNLYSKTYFFIE